MMGDSLHQYVYWKSPRYRMSKHLWRHHVPWLMQPFGFEEVFL